MEVSCSPFLACVRSTWLPSLDCDTKNLEDAKRGGESSDARLFTRCLSYHCRIRIFVSPFHAAGLSGGALALVGKRRERRSKYEQSFSRHQTLCTTVLVNPHEQRTIANHPQAYRLPFRVRGLASRDSGKFKSVQRHLS